MPSDSRPVAGPEAALEAARRQHWRATRRLTAFLLGVWFVISFVPTWFARDLGFRFFGWPFSFWAGAQGGVIAFVVLLFVFARRMARLDRRLRDRIAAIERGRA